MKTYALSIVSILILSFMISGDRPFYTNESWELSWEKIDSLEKINKFRSALTATEKLLERGFEEKDRDNYLRAVSYIIFYYEQLYGDEADRIPSFLENEQKRTGEIVNAVLYSMLGEYYSYYFQRNRWRISQRTASDDLGSESLGSMAGDQILKIAAAHYLKSIESELTKDVPNSSLRWMTKGDSIGLELRPSLYQVLLHRALEFFSTASNYEREIGPQSILRDQEFFGPAAEFIQIDLLDYDLYSGSYLNYSLQLYQEALRFLLASDNRNGLGDTDLLRFKFVSSVFRSHQKEAWYKEAIENSLEHYADADIQLAFGIELVNLLQNEAGSFTHNPNDPNKWTYKKAVKLADQLLESKPTSYWSAALLSLRDRIKAPNFRFQMEEVVIPHQDFLINLSYRNLESVRASIYRIDRQDVLDWRQTNAEQLMTVLSSRKAERTVIFNLPDDGDHHQHRIEIPFEKLDQANQYIVSIQPVGDQEDNPDFFRWHYFQSSDLFVSAINLRSNVNGFFVLDRTEGRPVNGAEIIYFTEEYDRRNRTFSDKIIRSGFSDKNGFYDSSYYTSSENLSIKVKTKEDSLYVASGLRFFQPGITESSIKRSLFYTDRSIYRPGQLLYFKGIMLGSDDRISSYPLTNQKVKVELITPERKTELIAELTTNNYGAFNGQLVLPEGLTGRYTLSIQGVSQGRFTFNVEEYKRPVFFVELKGPDSEYSFGEVITIKGHAKAFAGFPIQDAAVNFRISRRISQPFPWRRAYFFPPHRQQEVEIGFGETITNQNGDFAISFKAEEDTDFSDCKSCIYSYSIYAEVLDASGEMQTVAYELSISSDPLVVQVNLPKKMDRNEEILIGINTVNLDGSAVKSELDIKIARLIPPETEWLQRKWALPTRNYLEKDEFEIRYPYYSYGEENLIENWLEEAPIVSRVIGAEGNKQLILPSNLKTGTYRITIRNTLHPEKVILFTSEFDIIDSKERHTANREPIEYLLNKEVFMPGDEFLLSIGSKFKHFPLISIIENPDNSFDVKWMEVLENRNLKKDIKTEHLGGINMHLFGIKNGHVFYQRVIVRVPFDHKKFTIKPIEISNLTEPGSSQRWKFQLLDHEGNPSSGSVLASMYDQSLDQIKPHQWNVRLFDRRLSSLNIRSFLSSVNFSRGHFRGLSYSSIEIEYPIIHTRLLHQYYLAGARYRSLMNDDSSSPEAMLMEADSERSADSQVEEMELEKSGENADLSTQPERVRKNLKETVFFFPSIKTDKEGYFSLDFEMGEAMTNWKLQILALDVDFRHGIATYEVQTSSDLIVLPNWPRFLMQNDKINFPVRVINNTDQADGGILNLRIEDPITGEDWTKKITDNAQLDFTFLANGADVKFFNLVIPADAPALLSITIVGRTASSSDGEKKILNVHSSSVWITQSFPFFLKDGIAFEETYELRQGVVEGGSSTYLEYTSDPIWLALQSMPVAANNEARNSLAHLWNFYNSSMALHWIEVFPGIKDHIQTQLQALEPANELMRNEALRDLNIEETPWLQAALQQQTINDNLQLLLNPNQIRQQKDLAINELAKLQNADGGFSWFPGGASNFFITVQVLNGFGRLHQAGVNYSNSQISGIIRNAINFSDKIVKRDYRMFYRDSDNQISPNLVNYLFMKTALEPWNTDFEEWEGLMKIAKRDWPKMGIGLQSMLGMVFLKSGDEETSRTIAESLIERSHYVRGKGRFLVAGRNWNWYQNSIDVHSQVIELISGISGFEKQLIEIQEYLLHHRRVNNWGDRASTSRAIEALLANKEEIPSVTALDRILIDGNPFPQSSSDVISGSGYFKTELKNTGSQIDLKIRHTSPSISWGAIYHQYFEDIRNVRVENQAEMPIQMERDWMTEEMTDRGLVLKKLNPDEKLKVGQTLVSRIILKVDRKMEYLHIRDLRPSSLEPGNEISGYRSQDGIWYYYSPRDASTDFFIERINPGTYVLEYRTTVAYSGNFPSGMIKIQSYFSPEFLVYGNVGGELMIEN